MRVDRQFPQRHADFFWTLHSVRDPLFVGSDSFVTILQCPCRVNTLTDEPSPEFDRNFDFHVGEHERAHLQQHDAAKFHSEGETKHCRLAFCRSCMTLCAVAKQMTIGNIR